MFIRLYENKLRARKAPVVPPETKQKCFTPKRALCMSSIPGRVFADGKIRVGIAKAVSLMLV